MTIVFADLVGSTSLGERIDPESVRAVMDRYYGAMSDVVEGHGGRIVKFIGDGVMAVFGVPETGEDDTRRALDAAIAMHSAFSDLAHDVERDHGVTIALRVGVNTGEVIVSPDDDDVVGDAVNLAARLEKAADNGTVLAGEETWRLARGGAVFDAVPPLALAGKAEPVPAYRLVSIGNTAPDAPAQFIGRSNELDTLTGAFGEAVQDETARLAVVLGAPGVGKSRLAAEFERWTRTRATALTVRCSSDGASTLAPLVDLLRAASGLDETASAADVARAVGTLVGADLVDRDRVVASAVAILGDAGGGAPEETLWTVRRLLEATARVRPVVLVIDDLHWATPMMLDLVEHLAEWTRAPLLLLVLARPELRDIRGSLADGCRHTLVALEGLDRDSTAELARDLLNADALPRGLLARLPDFTGGNPLFVRELLRMLVDDGVVQATNGEWRLSIAPDAIEVPPTIQALLAARIDRLPADEQLLLERASIAGKEFPLGALRELLPLASRTAVDTLLESLRRKQLVEPDGSYWIDEPVYRFHHVLIRDAAYRRVLRQTRAELHERLALWLEHKVGPLIGEHEELVGFHLEQAHEEWQRLGALDSHGYDVGREASQRLGRAAERALDRDDLPDAAMLAARALACLPPDDPDRAGTLLVQCEALLAIGDASAAAPAVADLARISVGSPRLAAWHACFDCQLTNLVDPSRLVDSEQRIAEVATALTDLGDIRGAAKARTVHAATLARLGRFADVEVALDLALTAAREASDQRLATVALAAAPFAALWGPSPVSRAGGRCLDVVRLVRITAGSPAVEATSERCQAVLEAFRGRVDAARRLIGSARARLEELGLVHGLLETELFKGIVELVAGELEAADTSLRAAHEGLHALGAEADASRAAALLARVCVARGALEEAAEFATEAERLAGDDLQTAIAWRGAKAAILARQRDSRARAVAEEAIAIASRTDALVDHADARLALAAVRLDLGDEPGAVRDALLAADLYERKGATWLADLARDLVDMPTTDAGRRPETSRRHPTNRCTEAFRRWEQLFAARDWDALFAAVDDDYIYDDHRPVVSVFERGPFTHVDTIRALADKGVTNITISFLATRGELLALAEIGADAPDGDGGLFASRFLAVIGIAADGRLSLVSAYNLDDLEGATRELDDRYLAGEGAPHADIFRAVIGSGHAYNQRTWDRFRSFYATDVVAVDHRPAGWGTLHGPDAQVETLSQLIGMVPDIHMTFGAVLAAAREVIVCSAGVAGHDTSGSGVELEFLLLNRFDGARITEMEIFPIQALDAALAAFHDSHGELWNAATELAQRWGRHVEQRNWDALRALLAPGYVNIDLRQVISQDVDAIGVIEALIASSELGVTRTKYTPIAVRGTRLSLGAWAYGGSGPSAFEVQFLAVNEVDVDGRLAGTTTFDSNDLDAAMLELNRRFIAGEGAPYAHHVQLSVRSLDAYKQRDWTTFRECYADDFVFTDHRPATLGTIRGADQFIASIRVIFDVLPRLRMIAAAYHPRDHGLLTYSRAISIDEDGSTNEIAFHAVLEIRNGRIVRQDHFPVEAFGQAIRALDAYGDASMLVLDNACTHAAARHRELRLRGAWNALAEALTADFVHEDRRRGLSTRVEGRAANIEHAKVVNDITASTQPDVRCLAIRGDHLALLHTAFGGDDPAGMTADALWVAKVDEDARLTRNVVFDADEIDAAVAELDSSYLAERSIEHRDALRTVFDALADYNARNWTAYANHFHPDAVTVDHRTTGWGATERPQGIQNIRAMLELIPDIHAICANVIAADRNRVLVTNRSTGTSPEGTHVEFVYHVLTVSRAGLITRMELFAEDGLEAALARFAELAPS